MTLAITTALTDYVSAGGVPTPKSTVFPYFSKSHVKVSKIDLSAVETVLTEGVDYTVSPSTGVPSVGTVTFLTAITAGWTIRIKRIIPLTQELDLTLGNVDPENLEDALDKLTMLIQQLNDGLASASAFIHGIYSDPTLHAVATGSANGFMGSADWNALYNHIANVTNPHATTAAQVGAAPVSHVGSTDLVAGHPAATSLLPGFLTAADKVKLDSLPASLDPRNVFFDDFEGQSLDTAAWGRATSGTAPTASFPATEYGIYRETTAAANPSLVLLRAGVTGAGIAPKRNLTWRARAAFGATGGQTNCALRLGLSANPAAAHATANSVAYFYWDGTNFYAVTHSGSVLAPQLITPINTSYHEFEIVLGAASAKFYIDGALVHTAVTFPDAATPLERFFELSNLAANARTLDIDYCELLFTRAYT